LDLHLRKEARHRALYMPVLSFISGVQVAFRMGETLRRATAGSVSEASMQILGEQTENE
jgi:hypothetical protein